MKKIKDIENQKIGSSPLASTIFASGFEKNQVRSLDKTIGAVYPNQAIVPQSGLYVR